MVYHRAMTSTVYIVVSHGLTNSIFYTQTTLMFEAFVRAGARVYMGTLEEMLKLTKIEVDDVVVVYGQFGKNDPELLKAFQPKNRWLYVIDEGMFSAGSVPYEQSMRYAEDVIGTKNIIVTYRSRKHLNVLKKRGFRIINMPQCIARIRKRIDKPNGVIVSGQLDPAFFNRDNLNNPYYVERTRIAMALQDAKIRAFLKDQNDMSSGLFKFLSYPGMTTSTATHDKVGEKYLEMLDTFQLGVVCRAGFRDRFVGKYVEMAGSHVLPVGDCPTYMPAAMKRAMVNTEGMSDDAVVDEVCRLLENPSEVLMRAETFASIVSKKFMSLTNAKRVIEELRS